MASHPYLTGPFPEPAQNTYVYKELHDSVVPGEVPPPLPSKSSRHTLTTYPQMESPHTSSGESSPSTPRETRPPPPVVPRRSSQQQLHDRRFGSLSKRPKAPTPNPFPRSMSSEFSPGVPEVFGTSEPPESPKVPSSPRPHSRIEEMAANLLLGKNEVFLSDSLSLTELVKQYSKSFPVRIRVLRGYCGQTSRLTISTQDTYNIHFMKHTRIVVMKDAHDTPYSIPLNSAVEFSIVYDPSNQRGKAIDEGFKFEKVSEIMALSNPPKVICCLKAHRGDDERTTIYENETMIIKQIHKPKFKGRRGIRIFSLLSKIEKFLPEDFVGLFTTRPHMTRMHLPEMMEHVPNPFPCQTLMYLSPQSSLSQDASATQLDIPATLFSRVVTICYPVTETSLIASSVVSASSYAQRKFDPDRDVLFDIPVDENLSEIEVAVIESINDEETEKLYDDTRNIYEKFDPSKIKSCKDTGSDRTFDAQNLFYTAVRRGCENVGVELDTPSAIYDHIRPLSAVARAKKQAQRPTKAEKSPESKRANTNGEPYMQVDVPTSQSSGEIKRLNTATSGLEARVAALESQSKEVPTKQEMRDIKVSLTRLMRQFKSLNETVQQLSASPQLTTPPQPTTPPQLTTPPRLVQNGVNHDGGSNKEANIAYLRSMDTMQIQNLLEAMDLQPYRDTFAREHISGELLAEVDDEVLQHELGITSKLHRIRFMKVIHGHHSAQSILAGMDPYVTLGSQ